MAKKRSKKKKNDSSKGAENGKNKGKPEKNKHENKENVPESESKEVKYTGSNEIKSTAVVKYSVPRPPDYVKLQCNTDLNLPPANWLSSSADSYGLQRAFTLTHKGFASFRMAHLYPDCVGDVDVISDAENIKKLLKTPYTKDVISMFVHRVGNTLLIDNFDLYKNFTRSDGLFSWLRDFVLKNLSTEALQNERRLYAQDRSREALKHRSLISKFMYHSLDIKQSERMIENEVNQSNGSIGVDNPMLPNPSPEVEAPDPSLGAEYNRNVVWTFEDIEMLLGTDMPIFGGGEYPCLSLRLSDMSQPISILTGIDYWLDNLMSNVPEVVMCYHLNGFVQKYELIKTEDLPNMKNAKFSPKLIKDVAQNILSFLKANATKAGHTYWLFKDKEEDVIKLYDLTSLVPQNEKLPNPFTIPVAMLLYRVARNFLRSERKNTGAIEILLKNCIKLLPEEKYPEIVTSSYYILAEIFLPITTNPQDPSFEIIEDEKQEWWESEKEDTTEDAIKFLDLESSQHKESKNTFKPPPIEGDVDYRCLNALTNIQKGLNCLKYFSDESSDSIPMGNGMASAKSSEPIPMGYEKLNVNKKDNEISVTEPVNQVAEKANVNEKNDMQKEQENNGGVIKKVPKSKKKKAKQDEPEKTLAVNNNNKNPAESLPSWKQKNARKDGMSWKSHLKILLYEKAVLAFATLSEYYFLKDQYDDCFRNLRILARCSLIMRKLRGSAMGGEDCLLGRAGDCCTRIFLCAQGPGFDLDACRWNITNHTTVEEGFLSQIEIDEEPEEIRKQYTPNLMCVYDDEFYEPQSAISMAMVCYEEALKVSVTESMTKRLGNAHNEAGTYFLHLARLSKGQTEFVKKAEMHLLKALDIFVDIEDRHNRALICVNLAHMHRLIDFFNYVPYAMPNRNANNAKYYEYFDKALKILGKRQTNPNIWDSINWELSTSLFNEAHLMQDYPPQHQSAEEYHNSVIKALTKAYNSCDSNQEHNKYAGYLMRMSLIKYRMAVMYEVKMLKTLDSEEEDKLVYLVNENYRAASKGFYDLLSAFCYLKTTLKMINLNEYYTRNLKLPKLQVDYLFVSFRLSCASEVMIQNILSRRAHFIVEPLLPIEKDDTLTIQNVIAIFMQKFQQILRNLLKFVRNDNRYAGFFDVYKECYKQSLSFDAEANLNIQMIQAVDILNKINSIVPTKHKE